MKLNIKLSYSDFLTMRLYSASRDKSIRTKRIRQTIYLTLGMIAVGLYFHFTEVNGMLIPMLVFALITFLFYRKYFDLKYKQFYEKYVMKNMSNRFGADGSFEFTNEFIKTEDVSGESKTKNEQVSFVADLPEHFLIYLKMGTAFILPKREIDVDAVKQKFVELSFAIVEERNWRWGDWSKSNNLM